MKVEKAIFSVEGDKFHLGIPFAKGGINVEQRLVSGWATLDNQDQQQEVVTAEASKAAFARARGNIREMHSPKAVGTLVSFKEDSFYDSATEKFYQGIYVTVYVSKGAQDTWEKVLDGTLSGFSIGGNITDSETQWVKESDATVRFIKGYDLIELSLVDNPCNQLANIFSITKATDGQLMLKGMVTETEIANVYWCATDQIARDSKDDSLDCSKCDSQMENIGWFETKGERADNIKSVVTKFLTPTLDHNEGGVEKMSDVEITKVTESEDVNTDEVADNVVESEAVNVEVEATAKAVEAEDVNTDELDFEKIIADLTSNLGESLEKNRSATEEAVAKIEEKIAKMQEEAEEKFAELAKSLTQTNEKLDSAKASADEVAKRLEAVEGSSAIRKSGEVESPTSVKVQKSVFKNAFLKDLD